MERSSEKLDRTGERPPRTQQKSRVRHARRREEQGRGKKIGHSPVTFIHRDLAENDIMIKPLTLLAPWRAAGKVLRGTTGAPPPGAARVPPAGRRNYPTVATPMPATAITQSAGATANAAPVRSRRVERDRVI